MLTNAFAALVGRENVMNDAADLQAYAYDAVPLEAVTPTLVVRPTRTEYLGRVVALCHEQGLPLTVRSAGTNLSGGSFTLAHPDLSRRIGQKKRDAIVATKTDVVAAACPAWGKTGCKASPR